MGDLSKRIGSKPSARPVTAGVAYFAIVFGIGFVLGTIRVLWLAPRVGESAAGFIELPIILTACWLAARWLVARFEITRPTQALAMGAVAFGLLMVAEVVLATTLFALSISQWASAITQPPGLYGFIGQVAFGLFPLAIALTRSVPFARHDPRNLVEQCQALLLERFGALIARRFGFRLDPVHLTVHFVILLGEARKVPVFLLQPRDQVAIALEDGGEFVGRVLGHLRLPSLFS